MASAATQQSQQVPVFPVPHDAGERIALAYKTLLELDRAEIEFERIESVLRQGEFAAKRHNLSRSDQFRAFTRKTNLRQLLVACLGFGQ